MVSWVSEMTVRPVPAVAPNLTPVAVEEPGPGHRHRRPAVGRACGRVHVGHGRRAVVGELVTAPVADVPVGLVTVTSTCPAAWAGEMIVSWVSEMTLRPVPAVAELDAGGGQEPGPGHGHRRPAVGRARGRVHVGHGRRSVEGELVVGVCRRRARRRGHRHVDLSGDVDGGVDGDRCRVHHGDRVPAVPPKETCDAARKFVPVTITDVPPPVVPAAGLTLVTVGGPSR